MVEVRVLGPVEIRAEASVLSGADRQLAVLGMLVSARGQVVSADRLIDQLWNGEPPRSGLGSLQAYVSRLRRLLEPDRQPRATPRVLVSKALGYALRLDDDAVDAWAFERDLRRVSELTPDRALEILQDRLATWRGKPYEQFADEDWARTEISRLDELRWSAQEKMIEALLRVGRAGDAVISATALAEAQPLRGEACRLSALSLWAANRSAEALNLLRQHRGLLAEELGLDPEQPLAMLEAAILDQRTEVLTDAGIPLHHNADASGHGRPGGPEPADVVRPAQLPRPSAAFEGRAAQLHELTAQTEDGTAFALITGAGGVGKTTLALRWAHDVAARYPDGQLYADLRGFGPEESPADPDEILAGFLNALGVPEQRVPPAWSDRVALYRSVLAGRRMLLLLDNARDAEQVRPLLPGTPGCAVVVTGRSGLVGLVLSEGARQLQLGPFGDDEAREFLRARLGAAVADADPDARDSVIARCGGMPLALALVCARSAALPLAEVAAELVGEEGLDAFEVPGVEHDLRSVFSWSYRRLADPAADLFRRLALHPGPDVTLAAATAVAGGDRAGTRRLLRLLCDAHLLAERQSGRFVYHDLLRAYAVELANRFDPGATRREMLSRLVDHHLYSAANAAMASYTLRDRRIGAAPPPAFPVEFAAGDADAALAWLTSEYRNIMALAQALPGYAHYFAWTLASFQQDVRISVDDSITLATAGLAHAEREGDLWWVSYLTYLIGRGHVRIGRINEARAPLERSIEVARVLGDPIRLGNPLITRAMAIYRPLRVPAPDEAAAAYAYAVEAREVLRGLTDSTGMVKIAEHCIETATVWHDYHQPGGPERAVEHFQKTAEDETSMAVDAAETWIALGLVLHDCGKNRAAIEAFETAARVEGSEDDSRRLKPLIGLYACHRDAGDADAARRIREEALQLAKTASYSLVDRLNAVLGAER
ncbi:BTAD domain-containing putative transcriptional regulator [Actinoplanes sp. NPDC026670]|uniref:AfsR/SARP family transcriptional regulator n=1 Tax=Actinoplanes sp. NPDC026670 TaxID=3154700 RepID=UPI00340328F2